jgi:hypothetical protein
VAPLKTGRTGRDAGDYDLIPMEDGPASIASALVLTTAGGREVARITVPDKKIGDVCWAADGKSLALIAGVNKENSGDDQDAALPEMQWQSVWTADLHGKTKRIGDLPGDPGDVRLVKLSGDRQQVYYHSFKQEESSLWSIQEGKAPVEVAPRGGWDYAHPAPVYHEEVFLCRRGAGEEYEVYRVQGADAVRVTADGGWKTNLRVEGDRLFYLREGNPGVVQGQLENNLVVLALK